MERVALVEVPCQVRDLQSSLTALQERLGGEDVISLALDQKMPLEFRLSRSPTGHIEKSFFLNCPPQPRYGPSIGRVGRDNLKIDHGIFHCGETMIRAVVWGATQ